MLEVVLLDGELEGKEDLSRVKQLLTRSLATLECDVRGFKLRSMDIAPCQGCFGCWVKTPGKCLIEDDSLDLVRALARADVLVLLTRVTFGGYSSELKKALDRVICLISPFFMTIQGETHHLPRYDRSPRLLAVGVAPNVGMEAKQIFKSLVQRNAINLHSPAYSAAVVAEGASDVEISSDLDRSIVELEIAECVEPKTLS